MRTRYGCEPSNCSRFSVRTQFRCEPHALNAAHRAADTGKRALALQTFVLQSLGKQTSTSNCMTTRLATGVLIALLLGPASRLPAQEHPRAPQQSQSQQLPQTTKGAPQAAMTEATMSNVSDGLKEFISGYAAKSPDKKFHIPFQRKDLALDLVRVHDDRF